MEMDIDPKPNIRLRLGNLAEKGEKRLYEPKGSRISEKKNLRESTKLPS